MMESSDIDFIQKNYEPKGFMIEPQIKLSSKEIEKIKENGYDPKNYNIINNISYTISQVNKLRKDYYKHYDYVLMTRLDIVFFKPLSFHDLTADKIKPFMNFNNAELDKSVFYTYMDTPNIYRNQKKYITGIDLLMLAKPKVMNKICSWHETVLSKSPQGTENALTEMIVKNNIDYHLLYYSKPTCWTILRTNKT